MQGSAFSGLLCFSTLLASCYVEAVQREQEVLLCAHCLSPFPLLPSKNGSEESLMGGVLTSAI